MDSQKISTNPYFCWKFWPKICRNFIIYLVKNDDHFHFLRRKRKRSYLSKLSNLTPTSTFWYFLISTKWYFSWIYWRKFQRTYFNKRFRFFAKIFNKNMNLSKFWTVHFFYKQICFFHQNFCFLTKFLKELWWTFIKRNSKSTPSLKNCLKSSDFRGYPLMICNFLKISFIIERPFVL